MRCKCTVVIEPSQDAIRVLNYIVNEGRHLHCSISVENETVYLKYFCSEARFSAKCLHSLL